ncbi:class I SAM-dependent methyltransferase [Streptomyces albus]|uniref:class I SAM-dependent methyltransferase n=1 Tax=Streptomyces albus TaxID=1888 RepID=UPI00099B8745|nr:class I SAM-dependent methyltransferase [Streptomyces albus]
MTLSLLEYTRFGFPLYMAMRWGLAHRERPAVYPVNTVLRDRAEIDAAVAEAERLGLPPVWDAPKSWDSLGALHEVLSRTGPRARVLDAGAEYYSQILRWLYLYGYRDLTGINLVFERPVRCGPIRLETGDLTATRFADGSFDAVTCLSVIEHGVDPAAYFREMARILRPGGVLVTSTDYFAEPTDTRGRQAYGGPVRVFDRREMEAMFALAAEFGLELTGPVDLTSEERCVHWAEQDLRYSFLIWTMVRI